MNNRKLSINNYQSTILNSRFRYYLGAFFIFISLLLLSGWSMPSFWRKKKANSLYDKKEYSRALDIYQDIQIDNPDKEDINYNRGNTLYRLERYDEAENAFKKALQSKDIEILKKAYYNMGNTLYRQDRLEEAVKSYESTLKVDPKDEDAKYNIEFIKRKLQKQKQQDQQQDKKDKRKNKQDKEKTDSKQEQENQNKKDKNKSERADKQTKGNKEENDSTLKGNMDTSDVDRKDKISPEEKMKQEQAKQILDALKQDEKKLKKNVAEKEKLNKQEEKVEYDW